jgi:tetratricopeptide (TPR) repeat protein
VAAAVVVAVLAVPFARNYWHLREIRTDQQAVYAAQTDGRVLAGRYTGEPYHGKHSVNRGGNNNTDQADTDKDLAIEVAAGQLIGDAKNDSSPAVLRARALAEAINKEPAIALQTISAIPERARDAATWNDIAVITLANNKYPDALAAADRALQMQPRMPEALFTRWATLYDMHGPAARDVADAARQYLAVDPNSAWANEIREKMRPIQ